MTLATQGIRFGAFAPGQAGGDALEACNLWEQHTLRRQDIVNSFRKWGGDTGKIDMALVSLKQVATNGRSPMVSWEPLHWDSTPGPYTLDAIVAGEHDAYIRSWALGIRSLGFTVYFRPMHEMNGDWYHWGGRPELYVRVWRRIVDIFREHGATNAKWVWCVNTSDSKDVDGRRFRMEDYWPGEDYVDILGIDGYNCYWGWRTFSQINMPPYKRVCALNPDMPVWICETATSEMTDPLMATVDRAFTTASALSAAPLTKAAWIADMWKTSGMERVEALCWFNEGKGHNWALNSSSASLYEMRRQLRNAEGYAPPPQPYVPPVPDRVAILADGYRAARLTWRQVPSFARGFRVLRKTTSYSLERVVPKSQLSIRIENLAPGIVHFFAVQSYTAVRNSAASQVVSIYIPE